MDLPSSRTVRNNFLLFELPRLSYFIIAINLNCHQGNLPKNALKYYKEPLASFPPTCSLFLLAPWLTTCQIQNTRECIQSFCYFSFFIWPNHYSINITSLKGHQLVSFMLLFRLIWSYAYIRILALAHLPDISTFIYTAPVVSHKNML